jgi:hypothetical protein
VIGMRIIVLRYHMNIRERKSARCDDLNHPDRHSDFWPFTVRFITSFVSVDTSFELPTTDC